MSNTCNNDDDTAIFDDDSSKKPTKLQTPTTNKGIRNDRLSFVTVLTQESDTVLEGTQRGVDTQLGRPPNPYLHAAFLSKMLFIWPYKLMSKEKVNDIHGSDIKPFLEESDLPDVIGVDSSEENHRKFQLMWEAEKRRAMKVMVKYNAKTTNKDHPRGLAEAPKSAYPSLRRAIMRDFLSNMWFVQIFMFASASAKLVQCLALGLLLQSFDTKNGNGYRWAGVLVLSGFVVLMSHHHVYFWTWRKGMQYRISSIAAIYDKSLRLKSTFSSDFTSPSRSMFSSTGKIINLVTTDVERFLSAAAFGSYIIWVPLQSIAILGLGWHVIGWSFALGFALLVFFIVPFQLWLSKRFSILRTTITDITDKRVSLVSQAISGIRTMKISGWESNFEERIASIRNNEVDQIEKVNRFRALNEAIFFACNVTTSAVVFFIHVGSGRSLTPMIVYTTMVLMNVAQIEITKYLSMAVMGVSECSVSIGRIQNFLETPEMESKLEEPLLDGISTKTVMSLENATSHWNNSISASLKVCDSGGSCDGLIVAVKDASINLKMGQLTCIIGEVGSGKSALIQMLAGELPLSSGIIRKKTNCTISYAPQDPWIMQGTIRENILLGRPFNAKSYDEVVNACCLSVDFAQLRDGENTVVGDRGVQLSGGQRARIALARTFYCDSDILLLDDPLSAVDSEVGWKLFNTAIQDLGVNKGKCVVLVTHQHQFVGTSRCICMTEGRINCISTYQDCMNTLQGRFEVATNNSELKEVEKDNEAQAKVDATDLHVGGQIYDRPSFASANNPTKLPSNHQGDKEMRQIGNVKRETFSNYFCSMPGGIWASFILLTLFTGTQGFTMAAIAATGKWSRFPPELQNSPRILTAVVGLVVSAIFLSAIRAFVYYYMTAHASKCLHDGMSKSVLRAKIEFFDTNPLGRILNRFSADVGIIDDQLPPTLFDFLVIFFLLIGGMISTVTLLPVTLAVVPLLLFYFIRVRRTFVNTSRELKRLEGLARSPIIATLSETLTGIATIRSNDSLEYFREKFRVAHDAHGRVFFVFLACSRWLGFRMDGIMFVFLSITTFAAVIVHDRNLIEVQSEILGLALSILIQLSGLFQWGIRQSAEVVNQMVAVERAMQFRDLPIEGAIVEDFDDTVSNWPSRGDIDVRNLSVRYRCDLPCSLKELTFKIQGGLRVGIVGRSGCGKSTLVQSILRLLEAENGQILVDGVDISKMGLHKLRHSISFIPQTPVLFGGCSIRENLDPLKNHDDEQINEALLYVNMLDNINSQPHGLDTIIAEDGINFSVGQRQLLCMARAILRKNKILILDEPSANIDTHTDKLLQEAVTENFEGATIIAIAHRLDTVIDYDMILVLGNGTLIERGSPSELLEKGGVFAKMVDNTGDLMAKALRSRIIKC